MAFRIPRIGQPSPQSTLEHVQICFRRSCLSVRIHLRSLSCCPHLHFCVQNIFFMLPFSLLSGLVCSSSWHLLCLFYILVVITTASDFPTDAHEFQHNHFFFFSLTQTTHFTMVPLLERGKTFTEVFSGIACESRILNFIAKLSTFQNANSLKRPQFFV